ncbi:CpsD/CapB family tyrosine-protein kinase [Thioclava atlantica]|uniref:Chromosome partitioning ATPase-like protein n=1 Tax=Thioclava atlantica TaxID=1317124 RepID=A0A085TUK2_9RHOB|nr:CpsD/CapB family tyrosine-protein kinase [Thioclava atlantica]KFE34399.1 chromosome partitioning ATPase-like protein [Thioclava atlantica]
MAERLRDAIAKARAARMVGLARSAGDVMVNQRAGHVGGAWNALKPFEPNPVQLRTSRVVAREGGAEAAPFDLMRTKILQQMRTNGWTRLAITSPTAGCGKSTIALNLAFSFARQHELYSLLIEADLRRPTLARLLQIEQSEPPGPQMSDVFTGAAEFADHARRIGDNFALGVNSRPAGRPSELLNASTTPQALKRIEAIYAPDLVIFDTAPVLVSDDTLALAEHVDCVLIIAAAEESTIKQIDLCERELAERTNVMGVVVNKFRFAAPEYGYGYGYDYEAEG